MRAVSFAATTLVLTTAQAQDVSSADSAQQPTIQEVIVTGSYLRTTSQADLASPTQVIDADALARTGAPGLPTRRYGGRRQSSDHITCLICM